MGQEQFDQGVVFDEERYATLGRAVLQRDGKEVHDLEVTPPSLLTISQQVFNVETPQYKEKGDL